MALFEVEILPWRVENLSGSEVVCSARIGMPGCRGDHKSDVLVERSMDSHVGERQTLVVQHKR
jgi:hypothetical protein